MWSFVWVVAGWLFFVIGLLVVLFGAHISLGRVTALIPFLIIAGFCFLASGARPAMPPRKPQP